MLSFPSNRVLTLNKIAAARSVGIHTVVLWGPEGLCKKAACERPNSPVSEKRYDGSNRDAFDTYGGSEFADLRVEAFQLGGGRRDTEEIVEIIRARVFGEPADVGDGYPESQY